MADLSQNIMIRLMADTTDYSTKIQAASQKSEQLAQAMEQPRSTSERLESGISKAAKAVGGLSLAIGVTAVNTMADFDQSMSKVAADTGAAGRTLNELREAAIQAGARTIYNAKQSADAIDELGKAGMSTGDILKGGLNGALNLAASGQMGVAQAAELTATALNQFGLSGSQANHVADLLAAGANKAQGGVQDMGEALKMVGTSAAQVGMPIEQTVGVLTELASQGIVGSQAGMELRSALLGLESPSNEAAGEMQKLGISLYDANGKFVGMANLAGQLHSALAPLPEAERQQALGVMFSNAAMNVGNILYKEGAQGVDRYTKAVNQNGFAQKQAAALTNNLKGDLEQMSGAAETAMIRLGEGANGPLRRVVQYITNLINVFNTLDPRVQQSIVLFGGLAGAAGILHPRMEKLAESTGRVRSFIGSTLDPIHNLTKSFTELHSAGATMGQGIKGVVSTLRDIHDAQKTISASNHGAQVSFNDLQSAMVTTGAASQRLSPQFAEVGRGAKGLGSAVLSAFGGPAGVAVTIALAAIGVGLNTYAGQVKEAKDLTSQLSESMKNGATSIQAVEDNLKNGSNYDSWWDKMNLGAKNLATALDNAGISHEKFARAVAGSDQDVARFDASMERSNRLLKSGANVSQLVSYTNKYHEALEATRKENELNTRAQRQQTHETVQSTAAMAANAVKARQAAQAGQEIASAQQILSDHTGGVTDAVNTQASAWDHVFEAMKTYYGFAQSVTDGEYSVAKAEDAASSAIKSNAHTMDAHTKAGQANHDALEQLDQAMEQQIGTMIKAGDSQDKVRKTMSSYHDELVRDGQAMGWSKQQAEDYADALAPSNYDKFAGAMQKVAGAAQNAGSKTAQAASRMRNSFQVTSSATGSLKSQLDSLAGVKLGSKTVNIKQSGGEKARYMVEAINNLHLADKNGNVKLTDKNAKSLINEVNRLKLINKTGTIKFHGNRKTLDALAKINGVKVNDKKGTITLTGGKKSQKVLDAIKSVKSVGVKKGAIQLNDKQARAVLAKYKGNKPAGKRTVTVGANTKPAQQKIAAVAKSKTPPKTVVVKANTSNAVHGINHVNGMKIGAKTARVKGDTRDADAKLTTLIKKRVPPKTARVKGNNRDAMSKISAVNSRHVPAKTVTIRANVSQYNAAISQIMSQNLSKTVTVHEKQAHAAGGYVSGPGTSTSDSIPSMLSNGEYVLQASAVSKLGREFLDGLNVTGEVPLQPMLVNIPSQPATRTVQSPRIQYVQNVTNNLHTTGSQNVEAALLVSRMRGQTQALLGNGGF